ncbi:MAG: bifunctional 4-hydroxy-2-oxoglutarate aldolase/2-dehydro-3-deoxy-phosphogluconate aldolase [Verrucomicrobiota bacterium]
MPTPSETTLSRIKSCGIIAIIRGDYSVDELLVMCRALFTGGVPVFEITLNSTHVEAAIPVIRKALPDATVGAGTVRTEEQVDLANKIGAQFLVSPNFDAASVSLSRSLDLLHLPGVLTPTEAETAFRAGCPAVKVFPADELGPDYIRALRAPLDDIGFVPTGGVDLFNLATYRQAGALAVGAGSKLVAGRQQSPSQLQTLAQQWRKTWDNALG